MRQVRRYPPGMSAPQRRGHSLADLPGGGGRGVEYGRYPDTHPPGDYSERHVFGDRSRALQVIGPVRKMAQYAFTGDVAPVLALPGNYLRVYLIIQNISAATNLFVGFGAGATEANGVLILPNGGNFLADYSPPTDDVYIFFAAGAAEVCVICEGVAQMPEPT